MSVDPPLLYCVDTSFCFCSLLHFEVAFVPRYSCVMNADKNQMFFV
jgi:hypothetical protein